MIYEIFTVQDNAIKAFLPPFFCRSRGEALRSFGASVNEAGHQFNKYAADYTLFRIGTYDDSCGIFDVGIPSRIIGAYELLLGEAPEGPELHTPVGLPLVRV